MTAIDGAITLGGHVRTIHEKHVAVRAAERVEAVRAVARSIQVTMNDGTMHLHDHAPSLAALQIALHAAETAPGVTAVESEMVMTAQKDKSS
ncbi:MAG: BON domain-containing protein [Actinomycetota bacterium]|nr:BON domain-containing protein [Actinomycetota bacterium]